MPLCIFLRLQGKLRSVSTPSPENLLETGLGMETGGVCLILSRLDLPEVIFPID
jgi:hypothetical protein